jgi:hypothetical protein
MPLFAGGNFAEGFGGEGGAGSIDQNVSSPWSPTCLMGIHAATGFSSDLTKRFAP